MTRIENKEKLFKLETENIRNFSIIAHVDHGKSTLANALLNKLTPKNKCRSTSKALHRLTLEEQKGITIKLHAIQLYYFPPESLIKPYVLNLIDTPGHVEFESEVMLSLSVCEGAILLVDSVKGVQAQTLFYYNVAKKLNLKIIPVISKIDLPTAQFFLVQKQIQQLLNCNLEDIIMVSAKNDQNIDLLLKRIISCIPSPSKPDIIGKNY